jgi:DNA-binding MarR family transcriptional regulator
MADPNGRALRARLQKLIRQLGVLADDRTPCGKDLPVSDAHALQLLREHGPLPQTVLQTLLGIDKSNVSRLRSRLIAAGRLEVVAGRAEGRPISILKMTAAGGRLARQLEEASARRFSTLLQRIPDGKQERVLAALDDLNAALSLLDSDEA